MFTVYVLYSPSYNKIYIGQTQDMDNRLEWHNIKSTKGYTTKYRPWIIAYTESVASRSEALKREKQLKTGGGRRFIWEEVIPNL